MKKDNSVGAKPEGATEFSEAVLLVGSPNTGKTTLFNWLTNSHYKTVNYPGSTVDYARARTSERYGEPIEILDTPGVYSFTPHSDDERVTHDLLFNKNPFSHKLVVVIDATQLDRTLLLVDQAVAAGFRVLVALTMGDMLEREGYVVDIQQLSQKLGGVPVVPINGLLGGGVEDLIRKLRDVSFQAPPLVKPQFFSFGIEKVQELVKKNKELAGAVIKPRDSVNKLKVDLQEACGLSSETKEVSSGSKEAMRNKVTGSSPSVLSRSLKWDAWLLDARFGLLFFFLIMSGVFALIYDLATPFADGIDALFSFFADQLTLYIPAGLLLDFINEGVLASFAGVFVFVPQILFLFLAITFLEHSGYLARAAALIDAPLARLGLGGRSFVPLLSGFACAVPAVMAARNIPAKRERMLAIFVIPLMTCSARLPVYALLLGFLFYNKPSWMAGMALSALYLGAIVVGAVAAKIFSKILARSGSPLAGAGMSSNQSLLLELPLYRRPRLGMVLRQSLAKTLSYIKKAGPVIFAFAILLWFATNFPKGSGEGGESTLATSYAGQLGHVLEPVFEPMGVDWRVGVGLISAFAAREVFVSSLAVIFNIEGGDEADEESMQQSLISSMQTATNQNGRPIFTLGSVLGLLVFVMIALQCTSTTGVVLRETGSVSFAVMQVVVLNLVAYILAVLIYQVSQIW